MKEIIKMNIKFIFGILVGVVLASTTVYGATILFQSDVVGYDNTQTGFKDSNGNDVVDVKTALDELYKKTTSGSDSGSGYTITYNAQNGTSNTTGAGEQRYGTLPTPTKDGYYFMGWYDAAEGGNKITSDMVINENKTIYAHWLEGSGIFAYDSWADIKANLTSNRNFYPIGSEKIIEMDRDNDGTNEYYKLRLVNTEPCTSSTARSKTSCGVVIEFVTLIGTHYMNPTANGTTTLGDGNAGGWYSSQMRTWLNSDVLALLPSDLQSVIISTSPVVSGSGSGGVSNDAEDYLYLLSTREMGLSVSYDNKNTATDTNILSYYNSNNNNNARKKYTTTTSSGEDSSASVYWLRSANSNNTNRFYGVYSGGDSSGNYSSNTYGVAPAFRILD